MICLLKKTRIGDSSERRVHASADEVNLADEHEETRCWRRQCITGKIPRTAPNRLADWTARLISPDSPQHWNGSGNERLTNCAGSPASRRCEDKAVGRNSVSCSASTREISPRYYEGWRRQCKKN